MALTALYGLDVTEAEKLAEEAGEPAYRGRQLLEWIYKKNILSFESAVNIPKNFKEKLEEKYSLSTLRTKEIYSSAEGESTKFLFQTQDDQFLETVLISQQDRETVCVSTQLGCKIGCIFCASGKGKFGRNLTAGEIIEQIVRVHTETKKTITNVVFMGMGEPLDNFEATMRALKILQAEWGFHMSGRRITVSSSGITPKIIEFVEKEEGRVRLSISLHSSNEETRSYLVPINKKYSLKELIEALEHMNVKLKREITFEYTLINGINDSAEEAKGVGQIAEQLGAKVNIIPYNPISEMDFKRPSNNRIVRFREELEKFKHVKVIVRQTAGRDINAACGQLRLNRQTGS